MNRIEDSNSGGFSANKETIKRLADIGVVQSHGFGKYGMIAFGHRLIKTTFTTNPGLPLRTASEHTAREAAGLRLCNKGMQPAVWAGLPDDEQEKWRTTAEQENQL